MGKKYVYIICLMLLISVKATSQWQMQGNAFKGKVTDAETTLPVDGALVSVPAIGLHLLTNDEGYFYVSRAHTLPDSVNIHALGYQKRTIAFTELAQTGHIIPLKKQPIQLNEVIITASTNHQKAITDIDVKLQSIHNAQEVLRSVPGLFIGQHAGGGKAEQIFLRGFDIDHGTDVAITVDGTPVNMVSHAHGQGYADLHFVIPELIEKVHYDKGPYTASKGNLATAGWADLQTKKYLPQNFVKAEVGQNHTYRLVSGINIIPHTPAAKKSLYIGGEKLYTNGYFDNPQNLHRTNLFSKYTQQVSGKTSLQVTTSFFKSNWKASGQIPDRAVKNNLVGFFGAIDPNEGGATSRYGINAIAKTQLTENSFLKNQFYLTHYQFQLFSNFTFFLIDSVNGDQIKQKEKRNVAGFNSTYTHTHYIQNKKAIFEAGGITRVDFIKGSELSRTINRIVRSKEIQRGNINEANIGFYLSETINLNSKLRINGAVRADYFLMNYDDLLLSSKRNKMSSQIVSPKVNMQYAITKNTLLFARWGKGFHSNDARIAIFANNQKALAAAKGSDIGITARLFKNTIISAALWSLNMQNELVYVGDEGVTETIGETKRMGVDMAIRHQLNNYLFTDVNFNYARPRLTDAPQKENYVPLGPVFTSTGGLMYKKATGLNASIRYRYMANRPANEDYSIIAKGYCVADAHVNYITASKEFSIAALNLFNTKWKETQFATTSRLQNESDPVNEIHFTPGTPFFIKASFTYMF